MSAPKPKRTRKNAPKTMTNADRLYAVMVRLGVYAATSRGKYRAHRPSEPCDQGVALTVDEFNAMFLSEARRKARYAPEPKEGT